jgi:hypothetical protein
MGRSAGAEARSFWESFFGTTQQLAEKVFPERKPIPQRLKPDSFYNFYGTAEAMPLQSN